MGCIWITKCTILLHFESKWVHIDEEDGFVEISDAKTRGYTPCSRCKSLLKKSSYKLMKNSLFILNIVALIGSFSWFYFDFGWESFIPTITLIGTFIGQLRKYSSHKNNKRNNLILLLYYPSFYLFLEYNFLKVIKT